MRRGRVVGEVWWRWVWRLVWWNDETAVLGVWADRTGEEREGSEGAQGGR
jgi:hypothetical protein